MTLEALLDSWRVTPYLGANIVAWQTRPGRQAQLRPLPTALHPALAQTLPGYGINALYSHQATSWEHTQVGRHPVIVTGTASGKTLCYNLPVLHRLLSDPQARALYLFPTKALAHDQDQILENFLTPPNNEQLTIANDQSKEFRIQNSEFTIPLTLQSFGFAQDRPSSLPLIHACYDGDTPAGARPTVRRQARIVLTNPDMLHTAILPHHPKWADFLRNLQFIVIDEMHVYRGVFGSHVANVMRRLRRIARFYGARPQFILTSATIANPAEHAERLIEAPVVVVDNDGSAQGPKHFLIYNPPIVDPRLGLRRSSLQESVRLTQTLLEADLQTIVFARTRRTVELLLSHLRRGSPAAPPLENEQLVIDNEQLTINNEQSTEFTIHSSQFLQPIRAYRSGYLPRQRREIEQGLRQGEVKVVVATSALELGIDIGSLSAAVLTGYPGSIAATWQQAGRAGRQNESSLAVLVTLSSPLDQYLAHHPDYFFERSPEQALIDPDNLLILLQHLRCAAFELPFGPGDAFGRVEPEHLAEFLQVLSSGGELHESNGRYFWMADQYPAQAVSLRSASPQKVRLQVAADEENWTTLGEVDLASATWFVHPEAIYLHEGQSYRVAALDLERQVAQLHSASGDYYTEPLRETTVALVERHDSKIVRGGAKGYGDLLITSQTIGYRRVGWFIPEPLGQGEVNVPPQELHTCGYWFTLGPETVQTLRDQGLWSNDPNDYGPNWQQQRRRARARDGFCCQMCGARERDRQHDVHHRIPFRRFESYQAANRLDNLVTLCRPCHRRAETAVRMRSGLAGLATALGQLAPLLIMGDRHDLGVHADPQSALAGGDPAVVIYDAIPAGLGLSRRLFERHAELVSQAYGLVAACPCLDGCPSCIGPAGEDGQGGKPETLAIFELLK
jgi:DEAD/DEAH box helicase domain-containing protein